MVPAFQAVTIIVTAIVMALTLAHALELPGKLRLTREEYLAVQPIYYPGFTYAGIAEPFAIVLLAALLLLVPRSGLAVWLIGIAFAAAVLTQIIFWTITAPVNRYWLRGTKLSGTTKQFFDMSKDSGAGDWKTFRDRWERSHVLRTITAMTAFVLVVLATVI